MSLLHIVITDMREKVVTLPELEEKHILATPFRRQKKLNWNQVVDFAIQHPAYTVSIQAITNVGELDYESK